MQYIEFNDPHRRRHFDFFRAMDKPHFNITAQVPMRGFVPFVKSQGLPLSLSITYLICRVAHELPVFRQRIRGEQIVQHERVDPSFTVPTQVSSVFSFCTVAYDPHPATFLAAAQKQIDLMQTDPVFSDESGRDDYLFLSAIPWVAFTGFEHAMPLGKHSDSVPRISWGKIHGTAAAPLLPVSVQAHHALVDGRDTGQFFQLLEDFLAVPEKIFGIIA